MNVKAIKSHIQGTVHLPPSKSQTMRALLFGAAAEGVSKVHNYLKSPDTEKMITCLESFGAQFIRDEKSLIIEGTGGRWRTPDDVLDVGNSGIMLRFLTAIAANVDGFTVITGDESIRKQRPMQPLLVSLRQMGVFAESTRGQGFAPVLIKGPLIKEEVDVDGEDSQPVSALMIAGALSKKSLHMRVANMGEIPWVMMTNNWLKKLGCEVNFDGNRILIQADKPLTPFEYEVPGDVSTALFLATLALITKSEIGIDGLSLHDDQGDARFFQIVKEMGAHVEWEHNRLRVRGTGLCGVDVDINDCIDAIAPLAVTACFAKGITHIRNAKNARFKECDRIHVLASELKKMGARIYEQEDGLLIEGGSLQGNLVSSHHDHRMALAFIVAGLGSTGETVVEKCRCIEKTYASFIEDVMRLGGNVSIC